MNLMVNNRATCLLQRKANDEHLPLMAMTHVDDLADLHDMFPFPATADNVHAFLEAFGA